jgi:hypothetical protein
MNFRGERNPESGVLDTRMSYSLWGVWAKEFVEGIIHLSMKECGKKESCTKNSLYRVLLKARSKAESVL